MLPNYGELDDEQRKALGFRVWILSSYLLAFLNLILYGIPFHIVNLLLVCSNFNVRDRIVQTSQFLVHAPGDLVLRGCDCASPAKDYPPGDKLVSRLDLYWIPSIWRSPYRHHGTSEQ